MYNVMGRCNIMMILMVLPRIALRSKSQPELEWNGKMIGGKFYRRGKEGFYFYSYVTVRTKQPSEGFLEDMWSGKRGKEKDAANKTQNKDMIERYITKAYFSINT